MADCYADTHPRFGNLKLLPKYCGFDEETRRRNESTWGKLWDSAAPVECLGSGDGRLGCGKTNYELTICRVVSGIQFRQENSLKRKFRAQQDPICLTIERRKAGRARRCVWRGCYRIRFYFISTTPSTLIKLNNNLKLFNVQTLIKILIKNNVIQFYGKCIYER